MGTRQVTTTSNQYNGASMGTYNALQGPATTELGQAMSNPQGNAISSLLMNTGQGAAHQLGAQGLGAASINNAALHTGTSASNVGLAQRAGASLSGSTFNSLAIGASERAQQATGAAMQYRPLQTGGTQTQFESGAGTWAPAVIGLAASGAMAFAGAKMGGAGGSAMGQVSKSLMDAPVGGPFDASDPFNTPSMQYGNGPNDNPWFQDDGSGAYGGDNSQVSA